MRTSCLPTFLILPTKPSFITALHYQTISIPITVQLQGLLPQTGGKNGATTWLICCAFQLHVVCYQVTYTQSSQSSRRAINCISFVAKNAMIQSNLHFFLIFRDCCFEVCWSLDTSPSSSTIYLPLAASNHFLASRIMTSLSPSSVRITYIL